MITSCTNAAGRTEKIYKQFFARFNSPFLVMIAIYLKALSILIDFGLVVLIFMVQLTIYPSFLYYKRDDLVLWHKKYTGRIAGIVAPMMIAQGLLAAYFVVSNTSTSHIAIATLVLLVWISTFIQFVPIHKKISQNEHSESDLIRLVRANWIRVTLWTLIFLIAIGTPLF